MLNKHFFTLFLITFGLLATVFIQFPQIDLAVSTLFFDSEKGFTYQLNPVFFFMYRGIYVLAACLTLTYILLFVRSLIFKNHMKYLGRRQLAYLSLALALGPGLLVNLILKNNWGRARPFEVSYFGGSADFTPAFIITDFCETNCSFVSGHAAMGFYPMAIAFLFASGTKARKRKLIKVILSGIIFGGARIIQGSHFLSDVLFSGLFTFVIYYTLSLWIKPERISIVRN